MKTTDSNDKKEWTKLSLKQSGLKEYIKKVIHSLEYHLEEKMPAKKGGAVNLKQLAQVMFLGISFKIILKVYKKLKTCSFQFEIFWIK